MKTKKVITESELRAIIKESINEIFDNDLNGRYLGKASGLAQRATKSLKGKLDKNYKNRKERQAQYFKDNANKIVNNRKQNGDEFYYDDIENGEKLGLRGNKDFYNMNHHSDERYNGHTRQEIENWGKEDFENNNKITNQREVEKTIAEIDGIIEELKNKIRNWEDEKEKIIANGKSHIHFVDPEDLNQ